MRILFVHQNFPGQYIHIIQRLAQQGQHQMVALGINPLDRGRGIPKSLNHFRYRLERGNTKGVHPLVMETKPRSFALKAALALQSSSRPKGLSLI